MKGLYALFSFVSVVGACVGIGIGNGYVILFAFLSAFVFFPLWISSVRKEIKESPDYDPNDDSALCTQKELIEKATRLYFDEGKYSEAFPYLMRLVKESPHKAPKTEKMLKAREISQLGEFCHALLVSFESLHPDVEIENKIWEPIFELVNQKSPLTVQHFKENVYENRKHLI